VGQDGILRPDGVRSVRALIAVGGANRSPVRWYDRNVRDLRVGRAFVTLICIVLVLWCSATVPSAAHFDLALPVLIFFFLAVLSPSLLRVSDGESAVQPLSFLTVHISRPPPLT
jgi:hypothetical protein